MAKPTAFLASVPDLGTYLVFVAQPIPTHVHISGFAGTEPREWGRLRVPLDAAVQNGFETLCRRAIAQAITIGLIGEGQHEFVDTRLDTGVKPWSGELRPQA